MTLWFFQLALNLLFLAGAFQLLRLRRRSLSLEQRVKSLERQLESNVPEILPQLAPAATLQGSVLSEKKLQPSNKPERISRASVLEAYDKAELLLAQGVDLSEVARRTGLSVSELQLFGKVSQKNQ